MTLPLLRFMQRSPVHRAFIGVIVLFISGGLLLNLIYTIFRPLYYAVPSGDYFLNVTDVQVEDDVHQKNALAWTFCRNPRVPIVAKENTRTFYKIEDGITTPVFQRSLPDGIVYERLDTDCIPFKMPPDKRANEVGVYYFCQDITFEVEGNTKHANFCSNEYEVVNK